MRIWLLLLTTALPATAAQVPTVVSTECGLIVGAGVDEVKRLGPQFHFFNPRGNQHHVVVGEQSASAGSALVVPNTSSSGVAHVPALPEYLPQSTFGDDPFLVMDPETGAMIMNTATLNSIALRFFHERDLGRVLDVNSDSAQFFGETNKVVFPVVSEVEKGRRRLTLLVWDHGTDEILEVYREPTNNGRSPTVKTVANRFLAIASEDYEYNKAEGHFAFYDFQRGVTLHLTTPQARHGNLKISKDGSQVVWSDWQEGVKRIFTNQAYSIEDQWPKHSSDVQSRKLTSLKKEWETQGKVVAASPNNDILVIDRNFEKPFRAPDLRGRPKGDRSPEYYVPDLRVIRIDDGKPKESKLKGWKEIRSEIEARAKEGYYLYNQRISYDFSSGRLIAHLKFQAPFILRYYWPGNYDSYGQDKVESDTIVRWNDLSSQPLVINSHELDSGNDVEPALPSLADQGDRETAFDSENPRSATLDHMWGRKFAYRALRDGRVVVARALVLTEDRANAFIAVKMVEYDSSGRVVRDKLQPLGPLDLGSDGNWVGVSDFTINGDGRSVMLSMTGNAGVAIVEF